VQGDRLCRCTAAPVACSQGIADLLIHRPEMILLGSHGQAARATGVDRAQWIYGHAGSIRCRPVQRGGAVLDDIVSDTLIVDLGW